MIYVKNTEGEYAPAEVIKEFLRDCVEAGVEFNGTKEDKVACYMVPRIGRTFAFNRKMRAEIYDRANENKITNKEIAKY